MLSLPSVSSPFLLSAVSLYCRPVFSLHIPSNTGQQHLGKGPGGEGSCIFFYKYIFCLYNIN